MGAAHGLNYTYYTGPGENEFMKEHFHGVHSQAGRQPGRQAGRQAATDVF